MKLFSKLDLKDEYFQIPLSEKDRHKTSFRIKHVLYEWNVMPMGFKNAPAIFQRYMDNLLSDEIGKTCYVYVDDILIFGRSEKEHDDAYKRIREILERNKLVINEEKTLFKQKEVEFLGHFICENRIRPNNNKLQAINDIEPPKKIKVTSAIFRND